MFCFAKCCRLCLTNNETLVDYKSNDIDNISFLNKITSISSQLINESHKHYPKWICSDCQTKLHSTYEFIKKCSRSQELLHNYSLRLNSSNIQLMENFNLKVLLCKLTDQMMKDNNKNQINDTVNLLKNNMDLVSGRNISDVNSVVKHELVPLKTEIEDEYNTSLSTSNATVKIEIIPEHENIFYCEDDMNPENIISNVNDKLLLSVKEEPENEFQSLMSDKDTGALNNNFVDDRGDNIATTMNKKIFTDKDTTEASYHTFFNKGHNTAYTFKIQEKNPVKGLHACDTCNKKFTRAWNLNRHKIIHTGEKPYACDLCDKNFTQASSLVVHKRSHAKDFLFYSCDMCDKKFLLKSSLTRHKIIHTGKWPYSCDMCDKKFTSSWFFIRHERSHSGDRPYTCDVCGKKFLELFCLNRHKMTHTGERPYSCELCNKKFTRLYHLNRHKIIHTRKMSCSNDVP